MDKIKKITDSGRYCWAKARNLKVNAVINFYDQHKDLTVDNILSIFEGSTFSETDNEDYEKAFIHVFDLMTEDEYWCYREGNKVYSPILDEFHENFFEDKFISPNYCVLLS
jgi:hypothetical protein